MHKKRLHKLPMLQKLPKVPLIAMAVLIGVVGSGILLLTQAATPTADLEAENGSRTSKAQLVSDATASGAQAVVFKADAPVGSALTSRPNDGTGYWPDFSNTGYKNTPANVAGLGLPAFTALTDYKSGMSSSTYLDATFPDNSVISYKRFLMSKMAIRGKNLTFVGCLFEGLAPNDNLVQIYALDTTIKFYYSTFKPAAYAMPPGNDGTITSSRTSPGTPYNKSWQLVTTMDGAVATMDHNDIWGNAGMIIVTGTPTNPSTWTNNYIHDAADNDTSTFSGSGTAYHHDGIGPQSEGNGGNMVIDHNTIATIGNTNGIALQGTGVYNNVKVTNNYISGWGYAISIGTQNNATNITVTGNILSAEMPQLYGFLYGNIWGGTARGSTWRNNLIQARTGDGNSGYSPADNGKYYWPNGTKSTTDFSG